MKSVLNFFFFLLTINGVGSFFFVDDGGMSRFEIDIRAKKNTTLFLNESTSLDREIARLNSNISLYKYSI